MNGIDVIRKKLLDFARRQTLVDVLDRLVFACAAVLVSLTVAFFLIKSPLYGLIGLVPIFFFRSRSLVERAKYLEDRAGLAGEIVNGLQLSRIPADGREKYSRELIDAAIADAVRKIAPVDFRRHLDYSSLRRSLTILLVSIAFSLVYPAFFPGRFYYSLHPLIRYGLEPNQGRFVKGTEVPVTLTFFDAYVPRWVTLVTFPEGKLIREKIRVENGRAVKKLVVDQDLKGRFEFLDRQRADFALTMIQPLYVRSLRFRFRYPAYTGLPDDSVTGREVVAPAGTRLGMAGEASQPLDSARVEGADDFRIECHGGIFRGEYLLTKNETPVLRLFAATECKEPLTFYAVTDLPPLVDVFYPGDDINMPPEMKTAVAFRASDDYRLDQATFYYTFKKDQARPLKIKKTGEDTVYFTWDLSELGLLPGDQVSYLVRVWDNAGNTQASRTFYVYFPTMEEIYRELSGTQDSIREDLQDLQSEHKASMEEIRRIEEKIMKERTVSWRDKENLNEVISKEKSVADKLEEWQAELEKTIDKLNEGIVLDPESVARLQEISKILQEIAPEELKKALNDLQSQLDKTPEDIKQALEKFKQSQEELAKALERTLEILKRFQQEEKMKELAQTARDLADQEDKLQDLTARNDTAGLGAKNAELNARIDSLARAIRELAQSQGLENEIRDNMQNLDRRAQELAGGDQKPPGDKSRDLQALADDLQRLYEEMTKGRMANLRKNLLETLNRLIDISEALEKSGADPKSETERTDDLIQATKTLADSLYGQQTKSLYVTPAMGKKLAQAIKEMNRAQMKAAAGQSGSENIKEAMKQLNLAGLEILENLKMAGEGGSATGMDQLMKQLSEIGQGQMSLNQSLMSLFPLPVAGLSGEALSQIQRLAGKQRELRQALENLGSSPGAAKFQDLIDNLAGEMKETEEALYQYKLDRRLIERQKMILSRLIDAQKSIRQEDFQKERKSKTGADILHEVTKSLPGDLGRDEMRELIRKALKEQYPKEYESLIREYFKSLLEESPQ
jgi:hypothetical protein